MDFIIGFIVGSCLGMVHTGLIASSKTDNDYKKHGDDE